MRSAKRHRRRRPSLVVGASLVLAACSQDSQQANESKPKQTTTGAATAPGSTAPSTPTAEQAQQATAPEPTPSEPTGADPAPTDPETKPTGREAIVAALLEPGLADLDPDQMEKRFASAKLTRANPFDNSLLLITKDAQGGLKIQFQRDDADKPWKFSDVELRVLSEGGDAARAHYEHLSQQVKERLGDPKWESSQGAYLARGFELSGGFQVNVGAVMNQDEGGQPYAALVVSRPAQ